MKLLNALIDKFQATFPPNRIVVLFTPLAFMPLAGAVSAWLAIHFPGVVLPEGAIVGFAAAGALAAVTLAYKWLDHWQLGEGVDYSADVDQLFAEFLSDPTVRAELVKRYPELLDIFAEHVEQAKPSQAAGGDQ